jgi:pimeloyl-ACP methyl ester carboxylesterase
MFDARGHGRSDAPEGGYGPVEQASDLAGAITALGLRQPAILGHSMGAATALTLAGLQPDLPGTILLEDPPVWWTAPPRQPRFDEQARAEWQARLAAQQRKTREELIAEQRAAAPGWSEAVLGPWADAKLRVSLNAGALFDHDTSEPADWRSILPRITCPVLLITADEARGALVTREAANELRALLPHLRVAHVPGAGHCIRYEQLAQYLDVVRPFLAVWAASL